MLPPATESAADIVSRCQQVASGNVDALLRCASRAMADQHQSIMQQVQALNGASHRGTHNYHGASSSTSTSSTSSSSHSSSHDHQLLFSRDLFLLLCAALVFFMQAGFAMICAGAVRRKNLQNTMLKNVLDACGAALAFFACGYGIAFGGDDDPGFEYAPVNRYVGTANFFLLDVHNLAFWAFQYGFSAAAATIVAGTLAERCQMKAYVYYSVFLSGWVYPVAAHAIWSVPGVLSPFREEPLLGVGVLDFAGSGVIHVTGGVAALIATWVVGPRRGRFHDEITGDELEKPREIRGNSMSLQVIGTFILWFGWYGFNGGSALLLADGTADSKAFHIAALAVTNTTLSAGIAGIVAVFGNIVQMDIRKGVRHYDLKPAMNGILTGLVAISAGCGIVEPPVAAMTGAVAGLVYLFGSYAMLKCRLDDAVDGVAIHLGGGVWGMLVVGLFASPARIRQAYGFGAGDGGGGGDYGYDNHDHNYDSNNNGNDYDAVHPGLIYSIGRDRADARLLGMQLAGIAFLVAWCALMMWPFFTVCDRLGWLRSSARDEVTGLDKNFSGGLQGDAEGALAASMIGKMSDGQLEMYEKMIRSVLRCGVIGAQRLSVDEMGELREQADALARAKRLRGVGVGGSGGGGSGGGGG
mmetsp:Transcript_16938/g.47536  ORF Transcript_16938/g.47536 Transcript_16938/m.47536 type:complete len:639 (-) Transcript_16938:3-1919(-)